MKEYPSIPHVRDAPEDLLGGGHLWIQEKVDGSLLRFQLLETGVLRFGSRHRVYDPGDVPASLGHAVRHVRERLDRTALREAVDSESVVFFGEAVHRRRIDYDWERTPPFLGFDVWAGERFLPPDAVERVFERLGLDPVNAFEKEVRAVDFDPDAYDPPDSNWYDGPPEGVVLRNKTGLRATLPAARHAHPDDCDAGQADADPEELAREFVTDSRVERTVDRLEEAGEPVTFETVYERVVEDVFRERHHWLFQGSGDLDTRAFRSEAAAITRRALERSQ